MVFELIEGAELLFDISVADSNAFADGLFKLFALVRRQAGSIADLEGGVGQYRGNAVDLAGRTRCRSSRVGEFVGRC